MEWLENIKNRFKPGQVLSPQQLEEQQNEVEEKAIANYKAKLTPDFVRVDMPELYHDLRLAWLRSFHIEDLEQPQETGGFVALLPYLQFGTSILVLIILLMKK